MKKKKKKKEIKILIKFKNFFSTLFSRKGCVNCKHWIDTNENRRCDLAESGQCNDCITEPFSKWEEKET